MTNALDNGQDDDGFSRTLPAGSLAPAYVLHQYAYRDTSRIVEVFTSEAWPPHAVCARRQWAEVGAQGRAASLSRVLVSWSGRSEACQLVGAEIDGPMTQLKPERLMSGFYLNELLLRLTERRDPHPEIFFCYATCIQALCDARWKSPRCAASKNAS